MSKFIGPVGIREYCTLGLYINSIVAPIMNKYAIFYDRLRSMDLHEDFLVIIGGIEQD